MQKYANQGRTAPPWLYPSNGATQADSSRFAGDFDENGGCSTTAPSYQLYCEARFTADYASFDSTHGKGIAWAEGFADAFALRAMATRPGGSETSVFSFQRVSGMAWSHDFEPWRPSNTESTEHTNAAALRDLDDDTVDGYDSYAGRFDRVWKAFTRSYKSTIRGYWDNWMDEFHSDHPHVEGARDAMYQNDLITARALLLTASLESFPMRISLQWAFSGTNLWKYEVHWSTTPGFTPSSATLLATLTDNAYTITNFPCGTTYHFEVIAFNTAGWPAHANRASVYTGSCDAGGGGSPFVAPWNGTAYEVDNNILPLSEVFDRDRLDVVDHYRLQAPLVPRDGLYSVKLVEFEDEHSFFDTVALWAVDHDPDAKIAVDPQTGDVFTYEDGEPPASAVDNSGRDVRAALVAWDGTFHEGWRGDFVDLNFGRVPRHDAHLVIVADTHQIKTRIFVQVWNGSGWETAATMHHRMRFAEDVIDLSRYVPITRDLQVRLLGASRFTLEKVALDTSPPKPFAVQAATLLEAAHSSGPAVTGRLAAVDASYAELVPGEEILLTFSVPAVADGTRSLVFVSTGHYIHKYQPLQGTNVAIAGLDVSFQAAVPQAPLGQYWTVEIAELLWDFGDGTATTTGSTAVHAYAAPGEYLVTVRITFTDGTVKWDQRRIIVAG